jgi:hypothetical protein
MITLKNIKLNGDVASADVSKNDDYFDIHIEVDFVNKTVIKCESNVVSSHDLQKCMAKFYRETSIRGSKNFPKSMTIITH